MARTRDTQPEPGHADDWARVQAAYEQAAADVSRWGGFAQAVRQMDWPTQPADRFKQAVDMALSLGGMKLAWELAKQGHELYPDHEPLARFAHVLAPAKVIRTLPASGPELSASLNWFKQHASEYRGQWVVVDAGQLIGAASSRQELIEQVGSMLGPDAIVTHIV